LWVTQADYAAGFDAELYTWVTECGEKVGHWAATGSCPDRPLVT
jgi:hypothetical protein